MVQYARCRSNSVFIRKIQIKRTTLKNYLDCLTGVCHTSRTGGYKDIYDTVLIV